MEYLNVKQVAELLQMTTRGIRLLVSNTDFPEPIRISPKKVLYDKAAIVEWLNSKKERDYDRFISNQKSVQLS